MRIIAGRFKNRRLFSSEEMNIRPAMDRVKTFIFDVIGGRVEGGRVLDIFAGTGSLGIEALSREARHVDFVDVSGHAISIIRKNLDMINGMDLVDLFRMDARRFVAKSTGPYDLVFCDPPYRYPEFDEISGEILKSGILAEGGWLVMEHAEEWRPADARVIAARFREKKFGRTVISFFR